MAKPTEKPERRIVITQEDIARMVSELEFLENLVNNLRQNIIILTNSINDLKNARDFMKVMSSTEISDSYVTIGGGVFVKTKPIDTKKVLLSVGGGYLVETDCENAINFIENRIKELEEVKSRLETQLSETARRAEDLRRFLTYIYASIRQQAQTRQ